MTVSKSKEQVIAQTAVLDIKGYDEQNALAAIGENHVSDMAAEDQTSYSTIPQMEKHIAKLKKSMDKAAKDLDFMEAARLRDLMFEAKNRLEEMKKGS
jgi:excinuclease ABC subunit B